MDNITDEERKVVDELKRRTINDVTPKMLEDPSLFYRFCKARDFNIIEAEAMLRKTILWRREMGIDEITTEYEPPEVLLKYIPISFIGFDKEGCPVRIYDCGRVDAKGILSLVKLTEALKYVLSGVEKDRELVVKQNENGKKRYQLGKSILNPIFDFEELSYSKAVHLKYLQALALILKSFIDNYPEYLKSVTVINAPFYFTWIFTAMKPILPDTILQKLRVYGSDGWKEFFQKNIDADCLPAYLGGNRTDPDGNPLCETFIMRGQIVPKSYYLQKGKRKLSLESDVEKVTVLPFSKEEISFEVREENSCLEWEIETKNRDIDFSVLFRGEAPEPKNFQLTELIPKQRIDSYYEPEKGFFKCEKVGKYIIVFDNSYSWLHSKEIYYRAGIKSPNNNELF